ncbi:solute carrier family 12 member 2 [Plakobranchus ocellatus]|uniref:Solute carrier family 12 member 2 n=1 Tax=Plakobranchus ocellatus TaxID=259542 RepID=A0AAV4E2C1_9GAST|nr:solute carrier family 12 member 2 [Plakobranchus ocellatus]
MELKPKDTVDGGGLKKSASSRFQVARVDTKEDQVRENGTDDVQSKLIPQRKKSCDFKIKSGDLPKIETGINSASIEGPFCNGPESPNATTFSLSGDSLRSRSSVDGYSKTNCVMNTVEALPCVDHYRNIFSATGAGNLKARPTLAELHEERDDEELRANKKEPSNAFEGASHDSPNHIDNVQVVNAVRFGWIQGVLVISSFYALRQARTPMVGLKPATEWSLQISWRVHYSPAKTWIMQSRPAFARQHNTRHVFDSSTSLVGCKSVCKRVDINKN